jgi:HTH-type transcriptional regulator / antitoxin HipB
MSCFFKYAANANIAKLNDSFDSIDYPEPMPSIELWAMTGALYPTGDIDIITPIGYNFRIYPVGDGNMEYPIRTARQLAQALKGWRKNRNLTQAAAALRVGMQPKTISALESEPDPSSLGSLFKLLSALDLELVIRSKSKGAGAPAKGEW